MNNSKRGPQQHSALRAQPAKSKLRGTSSEGCDACEIEGTREIK